jgi:hypothetical protein
MVEAGSLISRTAVACRSTAGMRCGVGFAVIGSLASNRTLGDFTHKPAADITMFILSLP